ncbi:MAG: hypothetical protein ACKOEQ_17570 [Verrucomicrobiota bacterium]
MHANHRNIALALAGLAGLGSLSLARAELTLIDINNPVVGTRSNNADGSFTITAGGNDTWDSQDSFTYAYEPRTGDFDVMVQVVDLVIQDPGAQDSAKACLMARANTTPGSPNVQVSALPVPSKNAIETIYRPKADQGTDDMPDRPTGNTSAGGTAEVPNVWLRMRRVGNHFTTFYANQPNAWNVLSEVTVDPAEFPSTVLIGLSTVNHVSESEDPSLRTKATYKGFGNTPVPPPVTVNGEPAGDRGPGTYPNRTATGVNWKIEVPADGKGPNGNPIVYNGDNKNEYILSVDGQGPIPWSAPGYNQGDLDFDIGPRDAVAALVNTGPYGPTYNRAVTDPAAAPAQAWAPSPRDGIVLGSVRKLQQQWNDGAPAFHGFVFCPTFEGASRKGFSTETGIFRNMDYYFSFVKLGETAEFLPNGASPAALREANINVSLAWFPYAAGWKAGYVAAPNGSANGVWRAHATHSAALTSPLTSKFSAQDVVQWTDDGTGAFGGQATVTIPGATPADGMLFTISTDDSTDNRGSFITATPSGDNTGWSVSIRVDDENPSPTAYANEGQSDFAFLYVPYSAHQLVGGKVNANGSKAAGAGNFTVTRASAGRYEIAIPGKTDKDGMLILQNCGALAGQPMVADDGVLAWEYINGKFVVEARHAEAGASGYDVFPTRDTDFYFAWVDFASPMAPTAPPAAPALSIGREGSNVVVSWPAGSTGYTLESAPAISGPWSVVPGVTGNAATVAPSAAAQLFRLRQ